MMLLSIITALLMDSPPRHCGMRSGPWCITEGEHVVVEQLSDSADRLWIATMDRSSGPNFVVIQTGPCRVNHAEAQLTRYGEGRIWRDQSWAFSDIALGDECSITVLTQNAGSGAIQQLRSALAYIRLCDVDACGEGGGMASVIMRVLD